MRRQQLQHVCLILRHLIASGEAFADACNNVASTCKVNHDELRREYEAQMPVVHATVEEGDFLDTEQSEGGPLL